MKIILCVILGLVVITSIAFLFIVWYIRRQHKSLEDYKVISYTESSDDLDMIEDR